MKPIRLFKLFVLFWAIVFSTTASAQTQKSILVLDASGSMWGQIEGEAKITIAKRVIGGLLQNIPEDQAIGLSAYGHNRKGDCGDIELLVPPATGNRAAILSAVEAISPKGKTPLSAAVVAAAGDLKYTEDRATVILISDGIETCDLDPCAVGSELEAAGVDFTAHVIGFDVAAQEDRDQLACLAENTGGEFLAAANASELELALEQVAEPAPPPPPPAPEKVDLIIEVTEGEGGPVIQNGLVWTLTPTSADGTSLKDFELGVLRMKVVPGTYAVQAAWPAEANLAVAAIDVLPDQANRFVLVMQSNLPPATVDAVSEAVAGTYVAVDWTGPDAELDYVAVASGDQEARQYVNATRVKEGTPLRLQMPATPGDYELRYVLYKSRDILATQAIRVIEGDVAVEAATEAEAGTYLPVVWRGPDANLDYISIATADMEGSTSINSVRTKEGSPVSLQMPAEPGTYEIRYVLYNERAVLATAPIEVKEAAVSVSGPAEAEAGTYIAVEWEGPDSNLDYIAIAAPDAPPQTYINQVRTKEGSPLRLQMPAEEGDYELRYVLYNERATLASQPIRATPAQVSLSAPAEASGGTYVTVEWTGPDAQLDYIEVAPAGADRGVNQIRTDKGSPLLLQMPAEAGAYEIRYVLYNKRAILETIPITVTPPDVSLSAPSEAAPGEKIIVEWTGPDAKLDYIAISAIGSKGGQQLTQTRTDKGSPLTLDVPDKPGTYEIRYMLYNDRVILETAPLTVK